MKLHVRSEDTTIFYPLAAWSWESKSNLLIQRIPKITEVCFHIPGKTKTPKIEIPQHQLQPSLQIGQEIRLDEAVYYVVNIELVPPDRYDGTIYVYYLSELAPKVPAFWSVDVSEEDKGRSYGQGI